jgi:hypothetical protein
VDDKSVRVGGTQRIQTPDGYTIPLAIKDGLARLAIRPFTDLEYDSLPHVFLTHEANWDPSVLDHEYNSVEEWFDATQRIDTDPAANRFDDIGHYRRRVVVQEYDNKYYQSYNLDVRNDPDIVVEPTLEETNVPPMDDLTETDIPHPDIVNEIPNPVEQDHDHSVKPKIITTKEPPYEMLRPKFGWLSTDVIQKTYKHTTQYARIPSSTILKRTFRSPNPALNVHRRNEPVACDVVYADVPAISDGSEAAVLFTGTETHVTDIYGIKNDKEFVNTLEDNIRQRGTPTKLISDRAQVEISKKVLDILRTLCISDWQSEPYQQQQNPAERRYQTVKMTANRILDRSGAPAHTWLLCLQYTCYLLNHTYSMSIKMVPLQALLGNTIDISPLLRFHFWEKVYYKRVDTDFPSESHEAVGNIVGITEHCGHAMTWKILTIDTKRIIYRSLVRSFSPSDANLRADMRQRDNFRPLPFRSGHSHWSHDFDG